MTAAVGRRRSRLVTLRRRALGPVHDLRAGVWAARELRRLRGALARDGVRVTVREPPRRVSRKSGQVVVLAARVTGASCLERCFCGRLGFEVAERCATS